jgi:hypothetical protein
MTVARRGKELSIKLGNTIGTGAALFTRLKDADVNVIASCCYQIGEEAYFSIVPDDIEKAEAVLHRVNQASHSQDVLLVEMPNQPGAFAELLQTISKLGVGVTSAYVTATVKKAALAILKTADNDRVLEALSREP